MGVAIRAEAIGDDDLKKTIMPSNQACQECIDIGVSVVTAFINC